MSITDALFIDPRIIAICLKKTIAVKLESLLASTFSYASLVVTNVNQ